MSEEPVVIPPVTEAPVLAYQHPRLPRVPGEWTNVRIFAYRPEAVQAGIQRAMMIQAAVSLPTIVIVLGIGIWRAGPELFSVLPIYGAMCGMFALVFIFKLWRIAYRVRSQWPTFRLILADQGVMRVCEGYPDLVIDHAQVTKISESGKFLIVRGKNSRQFIPVRSDFIEGFAEIRSSLAAVRAIEPMRGQWLRMAGRIALVILLIGLVFAAFSFGMYTRDLRLELACAFVMLGYSCWSIWAVWRNPNVTFVQRATIFFTLMFPLLLFAKIVAFRVLHVP